HVCCPYVVWRTAARGGAPGRGRRAAGAGRPAGAPAGARGDTVVGGGRAPARGGVDRRTVRPAPRGGRGLRCPGGDRPVPGHGQGAGGGREPGGPVRGG